MGFAGRGMLLPAVVYPPGVGTSRGRCARSCCDIYRGADDNAAAVAILVDVAQAIAQRRPAGRGVIVAAFDGEEPPYFLTGAMGSQHFVKEPPVPLDRVDMMVCMDLVGHAFGPPGVPGEVRSSLFALGAERSSGTGEHV
ncbi:MAG TPA: M28 family peptidase, partial [Polyangiaceae bacterium]|nr:M28 family peptidase [Polyangiaceae bacterium]